MVFMTFEDTYHYSINTTISELEWNSTLPTGGAVVFLGPHRKPFTVSVFHQLRCLNIVRMAILQVHQGVLLGGRGDGGELVNHCMNYLRQMVLCRTDTTLETVRAITGRGITVWDITHTCKDWETVYEAAEKNALEYRRSIEDKIA